MRITALVENVSNSELKATHGLSLYIETHEHKILFDLGPDNTLFDNAEARNINLSEVDIVIISHGHMDHGRALRRFLDINSSARIYIQRKAFLPHYTKVLFLKVGVGLDKRLENHPQVTLVEGDLQIDEELRLFTVSNIEKCYSKVNDVLFEEKQKDNFLHEQNLIIKESQSVLVMGCGHAGVVNILEKAEQYDPQVCIGGYHLFDPVTKKTVSDTLLNQIAVELQGYPGTKFYTCHCTGNTAYQYLADRIPNMFRLSCGQTIVV